MKRLDDAALDPLFRNARTYNAWLPKPVSDVGTHAMYDLRPAFDEACAIV